EHFADLEDAKLGGLPGAQVEALFRRNVTGGLGPEHIDQPLPVLAGVIVHQVPLIKAHGFESLERIFLARLATVIPKKVKSRLIIALEARPLRKVHQTREKRLPRAARVQARTLRILLNLPMTMFVFFPTATITQVITTHFRHTITLLKQDKENLPTL